MPVLIVDQLEMIHIEEDQRGGGAVTLTALQFYFQRLVEISKIIEAGENIGGRPNGEFFGEIRAFDRQGRLIDQLQQKIEIFLPKRLLIDPVDHLEDADDLSLADNRDTEGRFGFDVRGKFVGAKSFFLGKIGDQERNSFFGDPSRGAFSYFVSNALQRLNRAPSHQLK